MGERKPLFGSIKEKIIKALEYAGWYSGRCVDISKIEEYYGSFGIKLSAKAKAFLGEYYGIKRNWYIEVTNLNWGADFFFELFPYPKEYGIDVMDFMYDDADYSIKSEEYVNVCDFAVKENNNEGSLIMVGEIGYNYPARVWLGESGILYATHDYDEDVLMFENVVELIEYELRAHELSTVAMK